MTSSRKKMMALWVGETMGFLAGCASTHLQTVKSAPEFQPGSVTRVLVVSVARTPEVRGVVEQEFARQWRERGVEADASSRVMPAGVPLDKAGIGPFAKAQGYSHVLVNRLMSRNEVEAETPESKTNLSAETKTIVASPQYDIDYQVAVVRTNLYDTATERLLWSATSQTLITEGNVGKLISPFVKTILKNLYKK